MVGIWSILRVMTIQKNHGNLRVARIQNPSSLRKNIENQKVTGKQSWVVSSKITNMWPILTFMIGISSIFGSCDYPKIPRKSKCSKDSESVKFEGRYLKLKKLQSIEVWSYSWRVIKMTWLWTSVTFVILNIFSQTRRNLNRLDLSFSNPVSKPV